MTGLLSLPKEITLDMSVITLMGRGEITIENYKTILEFTDTKIRLRTKESDISIEGERLSLSQVTSESVQITGRIIGILLV